MKMAIGPIPSVQWPIVIVDVQMNEEGYVCIIIVTSFALHMFARMND